MNDYGTKSVSRRMHQIHFHSGVSNTLI